MDTLSHAGIVFKTALNEMANATEKLLGLTFSAGHHLFFNGVSYCFVGLVAMFWLLKRLHKGGIDREDAYSALVWITIVCFVYTIMHDSSTYYSFLRFLDLPMQYVSSITAGYFQAGNNTAETLGKGFDNLNGIIGIIYKNTMLVLKEAEVNRNTITPDFISLWLDRIQAAIMLIWWWIMYLFFVILILAIACIVFINKFMATIILSLAPIVIPLLIIAPLRAYFFSWLKLYISYSLYAPIAMVIGSFPFSIIDNYTKNAIQIIDLIKGVSFEELANNYSIQFFQPVSGIIVSTIALLILSKVPSWVNQILGTQNSDGVGLAPLKAAGALAMTAGIGTIAARIGGSTMLSSIGKGLLESTPFGRTLGSTLSKAKGTGGQGAKETITNGNMSATEGFF